MERTIASGARQTGLARQDAELAAGCVGDDADLQAALAGLAALVAGTSTLDAILTGVAGFAVRATPGADGAGVTLLDAGRCAAAVASAPFVSLINDFQLRHGEGPGADAIAGRRSVRSGSLGGDRRWVRFGSHAGRLDVHSALALPLMLPDATIGVINVYARAKHAFDPRAEERGEAFAVAAAAAVRNAQVLAHSENLVTQLRAALTSRAVIDQAIGILMSRNGGTAEDAFESLRTISQRDKIKISTLATRIVEAAVRRVQVRRSSP